jgi:hypothetical protein
MSKAEEFIKAKTRIGSNTTKGWRRNGVSIPSYSLPWLTPDDARKAVEIAREEVIKKVCEFLENDLCCYIKAQDFAIEHQRLENDLKQAMRDE